MKILLSKMFLVLGIQPFDQSFFLNVLTSKVIVPKHLRELCMILRFRSHLRVHQWFQVNLSHCEYQKYQKFSNSFPAILSSTAFPGSKQRLKSLPKSYKHKDLQKALYWSQRRYILTRIHWKDQWRKIFPWSKCWQQKKPLHFRTSTRLCSW